MSANGHSSDLALPTVVIELVDHVRNCKIDTRVAVNNAREHLIKSGTCNKLDDAELDQPIPPWSAAPDAASMSVVKAELDPLQVAYIVGPTIDWLSCSGIWLEVAGAARLWKINSMSATASWLSQNAAEYGKGPLTMRDIVVGMAKGHMLQGSIAYAPNFSGSGVDPVVLVRLASTAVMGELLGLSRDDLINAISVAFVTGRSLWTHSAIAKSTGSRQSQDSVRRPGLRNG